VIIKVNFAFLREGSSDDGLIPHLRDLLVRAGADEAFGTSRPYLGTVESKLRALAKEAGTIDLVFVHRDADGPDSEPRRDEVAKAVQRALPKASCIAVVPVQELEAWLLLDELAIRAVVGRPHGNASLDIPAVKAIESTGRPKELLERACLLASGTSGRRRVKEKKMFSQRRRVLLERLDPAGPISSLPAWQMLERDIEEYVSGLLANGGGQSSSIANSFG